MDNQARICLDENKQTLYFPGGCDDAAASCRAVCCRRWNVPLSISEEGSRLYDSETLCLSTAKACGKTETLCLNRRSRLKKKPDGSCVYLDPQSRCSIYSTRPAVCRAFTCSENGWLLSPQARDMVPDIADPNVDSALIRERLRMDVVFVKNPSVEFRASFYSSENREIVLVVRQIDKCGTASRKAHWENPGIGDDVLSFIITCFDGAHDCFAVRNAVASTFGTQLSDKDFLDIILLLHVQNLIVFKMMPSLKQQSVG